MGPDVGLGVRWHVVMRPGKRRELDNNPNEAVIEKIEILRVSARAMVAHSFRPVEFIGCSRPTE